MFQLRGPYGERKLRAPQDDKVFSGLPFCKIPTSEKKHRKAAV